MRAVTLVWRAREPETVRVARNWPERLWWEIRLGWRGRPICTGNFPPGPRRLFPL